LGNHADAVRIVAREIGGHQVVGRETRLACIGAGGQPEVDDPLVKGLGGNAVFAHGFPVKGMGRKSNRAWRVAAGLRGMAAQSKSAEAAPHAR
jgi:hypothetical protein